MSKPRRKSSGFSNTPKSKSKNGNPDKKRSFADHTRKEHQAIELINQGKPQEAERIYRDLITSGTKNHIVYGNLAAILGMQGRFNELIDLLRKTIELEPNYPDAHNNLGNALKKKGDLAAAITSYNTALQLQPNYPDAHYNLGNALQEQGDLTAAIASYSTAIQLQPNYPDAHNNLGVALQEQGDLTAAIDSYRAALQLQPNYPDAHYNLGDALQEQGDLTAAIASYNTALQIQPDYPGAHDNLGNALQKQGELTAAIACYNSALQLQPDHPGTYYNLGNALQSKGDLTAAIDSYQKAIEMDPDNSDVLRAMGRAHQKKGDIDEGILYFLRAIDLNPNNTAAFFELSKSLNSSEEAIKLAADLEKLDKKEFNNREASFLEFALANCFHKAHNYTKAAQHLTNANKQKLIYMSSDLASQLKESTLALSISEKIQIGEPSDGTGRIFIVGAPRCGSTLLESVLATNSNIKDLGESQAFAQALAHQKAQNNASKERSYLAKAYTEAAKESLQKFTHSVDKNLYNFRFVDAIKRSMPAAKIIHCRRNPLDNILSMLRSNLSSGNNYTADPLDAAKFLIHQEELLCALKEKHGNQIFTFDYDNFTNNPETKARELIEWIGLQWNSHYLHPEQSDRAINTASVIQARRPISNRSVGGWTNYKDLLEPAKAVLQESGLFNIDKNSARDD